MFLDQFASMGGGQRLLLDVIRDFQANGWGTHLLTPECGELTNRAVTSHHLVPMTKMTNGSKSPRDMVTWFRDSKRVARSIYRCDPDVVYCNGPRMLLAAVMSKKPVIAAVHLIHSGLERRLMEWQFRRPSVKRVVFCSGVAAKQFKTKKKETLENWVSPEVWNAPNRREDTRQSLGVQGFAVGVLGRISPHKGQERLCEALRGFDGTLYVAGDTGHEEGSLDDLRAKYPEARFLGAVRDTAAFIDAMDVMVVPSQWEEPFGLVAVEAMARGVPVIVTESGALPTLGPAQVVPKDLTGIREAIRNADVRLQNPERFRPEAKLARVRELTTDACNSESRKDRIERREIA